MGLLSWAKGFFSSKKELILPSFVIDGSVDYYVKRLAINSSVDMIANTISQCEVQTYKNGKKVKENNYYLLNVESNENQNASNFIHEVIYKMIYENECLVVMYNDQLLIADSYNVECDGLKGNIYKDIYIGDNRLNGVYREIDVLVFRLSKERIVDLVSGLYESYGQLLKSSMNYYKRKNNKRLLIKGDFLRAQDDEMQEELDSYFESQLKNWFNADKEAAAFNLQDGYSMEDMSEGIKGSNAGSSSSRDISELVDDIFNFVAFAFHIPRGLLKGDISDIESNIDSYLMFAVNPIVEKIVDEINRKMYTKQEYLSGSYVKIDTKQVKITDLTKLATAFDKLFAIGGMTINDILEELGKERLKESWADKHYVTKNYQDVETLERGDSD